MARPILCVALAAGILALAACGSGSGSASPTWVPKPDQPSEGPGVSIVPALPYPSPGAMTSDPSASGAPGSPSPGSSSSADVDPLVVATRLTTPVGVAILPDFTALVGERTTGDILRVQTTAGRPTPVVKQIPGLDTAGDGGLLDLALSPDYSQDNLIYAYVTTPTDNRVVEFTLNGPVTSVFTGIPRGASGNAGRLAFGADGDLYIATGTAGNAAAAANPTSLAGKILRINAVGQPAPGNPTATSPVYAVGAVGASGLCLDPTSTTLIETQPGSVNRVTAGAVMGTAGTRLTGLPSDTPTPGGCAVQSARLWVGSPGGQAALSAALSGRSGGGVTVGSFSPVLATKYGRLLTVVAAGDGSLWLTTTNRDGLGHPVAADERVIRYVPSASASPSGAPY